ncbi:hypothetical protein [Pantoea stewartii]|uniref:hypothetical protein n=1 Tax=Pantoea stewartii TaxID=66269 RepID=UPI0006D08144|nr:hypothetical protein [Pantoea stewartii]
MNLQEWDNVVSITSNAVTAAGVIGGLLFGRSKIKEYFKNKKNEVAFNSALETYDGIIKARSEYGKIGLSLIELIYIAQNSYEQSISLEFKEFQRVQFISNDIFEDSMHIQNLFTRSHNLNISYNDKNFHKIEKAITISGKISQILNEFTACLLKSINGKVVSETEVSKLKELQLQFAEQRKKYIDACWEIQKVKFDDLVDFD